MHSGRWIGLCPFHSDSKPSFVVYKDGGYHCFGCKAHGSFNTFIEYFGGDSQFNLNRIDITLITNDVHKLHRDNFKKEINNKIIEKVKNNPEYFKVLDIFDQIWATLDFRNMGTLDTAVKFKRNFKRKLQKKGVFTEAIAEAVFS